MDKIDTSAGAAEDWVAWLDDLLLELEIEFHGGIKYIQEFISAISAERDALRARVEKLETNIQVAIDASKTELNLGNYDHDDVCALQAESLDIWTVLTAALTKEPNP